MLVAWRVSVYISDPTRTSGTVRVPCVDVRVSWDPCPSIVQVRCTRSSDLNCVLLVCYLVTHTSLRLSLRLSLRISLWRYLIVFQLPLAVLWDERCCVLCCDVVWCCGGMGGVGGVGSGHYAI